MEAAVRTKEQARPAFAAPITVGLAHFAAAALSLTLARWSNGLASVWVPNAILLAYLLLTPRRDWTLASLAVIGSGTFANWIGGAPLPLAALFGATNAFEPLGIALLLRAGRRSFDFERIVDLLRFVGAALLLTTLSALLAGLVSAGFYDANFRSITLSWLTSTFLGLVIATPLLLVGHRHLRSPALTRAQAIEALTILGGVALVGALVFAYGHWPLYFLLQPPILIATFRLRALGAAASVLLLATIGTLALASEIGSLGPPGGGFGAHMAVLQTFLAVAILTTLPVAALLSERDRYHKSLVERENQLAAVVDVVRDVIFRTDRGGRWSYLNPAWESLTGYTVEESIGQSFLSNVLEEDRQALLDRLEALNCGALDSVTHQFRFRTALGELRWAEAQAGRLNDATGALIGSAGILVDVSDRLALAALADDARRRAERDTEAALLLAATDELTGVASRRAFLAMLERQLAEGKPLSVALFDVDHFKRVNDCFGHAIGDEVLRSVARIAQGCLREGDLVGRLGGEEFAILMPGATLEKAAAIGERLRAACADAVHRPELTATVSLGIAAADQGTDAATLLRDADAALYRAKFEGRNCLRLAA